jgi:hypothetical protein
LFQVGQKLNANNSKFCTKLVLVLGANQSSLGRWFGATNGFGSTTFISKLVLVKQTLVIQISLDRW